MRFVGSAGLRIGEVLADFATTISVRRRPAGEVETFASGDDGARLDAPMSSEDLAHILLRFEGDARGSIVVSHVSSGRKNSLRIEVDGYPTFRDGHVENVLGDALALSNRERRWVEVPS